MPTADHPPLTTDPPEGHVSLTINGKRVVARKGTLLVEAARQAGIDVPVFCYHPKLKSVGACRMCLVQIEKMPRLQTACTTPVGQDMVVHTDNREVAAAQNGVIELLLANHPLDCPICDKGGECPLQDNTFAYGRGVSRFQEEKRHLEKAFPLSDRIVLDRERCIMCYRCVRFQQEIPGDEALAAIDRGAYTEIGTLPGESFDSIFSGNTIELCPVGALTSRQYRFRARPWDLVRTPSVCNGCAVGCNVEVHGRAENVLRLVSRENIEVDDGWLCDLGRFDTLPPRRDQRPARPMVRARGPAQGTGGGELQPASWEVALARAAELLAGAAGLLASPALSNEALWLLGNGLRTRLPERQAALWPPQSGAWPVEGKIVHVAKAKTILLVGLDAWNDLPVLALWVRRATEAGARLVVVGPANGLFRDTAHWLKCPTGWESRVAQALLDALNGTPPADIGDLPAGQLAAAAASLASFHTPAVVLAGASVAHGPDARQTLHALAARLGANGETGMVGAPSLAANGRGAQEIAPELTAAEPERVLRAAVDGTLSALLLVGDEPWTELDTGAARLVVATAHPVPADDPRIDVVLPLAHPYERQGTITNLEGRVQHQEGGALAGPHARADYSAVASLIQALGGAAPMRLSDIRHAIAAVVPAWGDALQPRGPRAAGPMSWAGSSSATSPGEGSMPLGQARA